MTKRCRFCAEEIQAQAILCRFCGREQRIAEKNTSTVWTGILAGVLMVGFVGLVVLFALKQQAAKSDSGGSSDSTAFAPPPPPPPPPPTIVSVADEPYRHLRAGESVAYTFELDDQRSCRLSGHLDVTQGGSRDVDVFVTDADGYQNFQNGNSASTYFIRNRTTAVTFDLPVSGYKKYYLVISNAFSMFTGKNVALENIRGICE